MKSIMFLITFAAGIYFFTQTKTISLGNLSLDPGDNKAATKSENITEVPATPEELALAAQLQMQAGAARAAKQQLEDKTDEEVSDDKPQRQVQIHGKWYNYRSDNTYLVNGVPTLFIPKKSEIREPIKTKVIAVTHLPGASEIPVERRMAAAKMNDKEPVMVAQNPNQAKSQKLMNMVGSNPLKVYTPEGFKTLKDGLEAVKNSNHNRDQQLKQFTDGQ